MLAISTPAIIADILINDCRTRNGAPTHEFEARARLGAFIRKTVGGDRVPTNISCSTNHRPIAHRSSSAARYVNPGAPVTGGGTTLQRGERGVLLDITIGEVLTDIQCPDAWARPVDRAIVDVKLPAAIWMKAAH
ncbi:hypothetical protein [Paraburkholderia sediminicola]|uniref:hypothetical protein n=1 Tax=Paraburkholderia sediminicola TaxID=458836 RepID=UPI00106112FD